MKTKVLIIGAGPSGAMAAFRLMELGFKDFIIVDREKFPRIKPCAGGISPATEKFMKKIGIAHLLTEIKPSASMKSLRFVGPKGQDSIVESKMKAMAIPRRVFDKVLLDLSLSKGAKFIQKFNVSDLLTDSNGKVTGATDGKIKIDAEVTIIANGGHNSEMRNKYFPDKRKLRLIQSRIGWWKNFVIPEGRLEMIFDKELLPHYGWVFPEGDGIVNIGICVNQDKLDGKTITEAFDNFIEKYYKDKISTAVEIGKILSYPINVASSVKGVAGNGILLCGEAGRMCNPATAEGISFAMESGYIAAEAVVSAYASGSMDGRKLYLYEKMCRKAFNKRLMSSFIASKVIDSFLFNWLIKLGSLKSVNKLINAILPN
jgi:geranylgeranyl reductase family protein